MSAQEKVSSGKSSKHSKLVVVVLVVELVVVEVDVDVDVDVVSLQPHPLQSYPVSNNRSLHNCDESTISAQEKVWSGKSSKHSRLVVVVLVVEVVVVEVDVVWLQPHPAQLYPVSNNKSLHSSEGSTISAQEKSSPGKSSKHNTLVVVVVVVVLVVVVEVEVVCKP